MTDSERKIKLSKIVSEAVERSMEKHCGCSGEKCMEKCGFTPAEHASKHQRIDELVDSVDSANENIRGTITKTITVLLISLVGVGITFAIYEGIQRISKAFSVISH